MSTFILQGVCIQPHSGEGGQVPGQRGEGDEDRWSALAWRDGQQTEEASSRHDAGQGRHGRWRFHRQAGKKLKIWACDLNNKVCTL